MNEWSHEIMVSPKRSPRRNNVYEYKLYSEKARKIENIRHKTGSFRNQQINHEES